MSVFKQLVSTKDTMSNQSPICLNMKSISLDTTEYESWNLQEIINFIWKCKEIKLGQRNQANCRFNHFYPLFLWGGSWDGNFRNRMVISNLI